MNILLSLDEIMDTRLGTLHLLDKQFPKTMLQSDWHNRDSDRLILEGCNLSISDYFKAYGKRNVNVLKSSIRTNIVEYINTKLVPDLIDYPEIEEMDSTPTLILNVFPYQLDKEEKDSFSILMKHIFPFADKVKLVNMSPKTITPNWLKDNGVYYFFNYDGVKWINIQSDALLECPLTRLKLYMPTIEQINAEPVTVDMQNEYPDVNRFDLVAIAWSIYFTIQYIPVSEFSIIKRG